MIFSSASHKANIHFYKDMHHGMTTVNTFIHYPSLSCARVMHFLSAPCVLFVLCACVPCVVCVCFVCATCLSAFHIGVLTCSMHVSRVSHGFALHMCCSASRMCFACVYTISCIGRLVCAVSLVCLHL